MQLYCKFPDQNNPTDGFVFARHEDDQVVDRSLYPGCTVIPYWGDLRELGKYGPEPMVGYPDSRFYRAPPVTTPAELSAYAALVRYDKEIGGITLGGTKVATDRDSQSKITGAWATVQINPSVTVQWKGSDGKFVTLDATAITAIASAVTAHVQACFAKEAEVDTAINATPPTITTMVQIDAAFVSVSV